MSHRHGMYEALNGKTPAQVAGIEVKGQDKWLTIIQNASKKNASGHSGNEKRLDDLYSPLCHYAWPIDRGDFPKKGNEDYYDLLDLLHQKNYLMSRELHYFYVGYVLATKLSDDAFTGNRQGEFIRIVRADYEMIRRQYLSFWNLLIGLFKPNILGYKPTLEK